MRSEHLHLLVLSTYVLYLLKIDFFLSTLCTQVSTSCIRSAQRFTKSARVHVTILVVPGADVWCSCAIRCKEHRVLHTLIQRKGGKGNAVRPTLKQLPSDVAPQDRVFALTAFVPHACEAHGNLGAMDVATEEAQDARSQYAAHQGNASQCDDSQCQDNNTAASGCLSQSTTSLNLKSSIQFRSMTSTQLAALLREKYNQHNKRWGLADVREAIIAHDPRAASLAKTVLGKLKGLCTLTGGVEMELIQGLAACLRRRGFGVTLHIADAKTVKTQILAIARKRYYAVMRKKGVKATRFNPDSVSASLNAVNEYVIDADGKPTEEKQQYLLGWTVIPPNMMGDGVKNFMPVNALDCAAKRGRGSGVLVVRATMDANDNIHPMSVSDVLAPEGLASVGAHMAVEKIMTNMESVASQTVCIVDGGPALLRTTKREYPEMGIQRCYRHLIQQLQRCKTSRAIIPAYEQVVKIPKNHAKVAQKILSKLPSQSALKGIPKEELCQVYQSVTREEERHTHVTIVCRG